MEKKIGKKVWLAYGKLSGFGIGFQISRYNLDLNLGFWFIGFEF
jgi:hypothetical protein